MVKTKIEQKNYYKTNRDRILKKLRKQRAEESWEVKQNKRKYLANYYRLNKNKHKSKCLNLPNIEINQKITIINFN
tara:strand:+ start:1179 stop:1406 length:228 start_codon:yes stop_codon:yes gene_type:complete